ncbi:LysR family transcriptional regulator [Leisingera sp. F5]|uniref:LysR family transcriptional regulator n=1 Tax=Leisingera sp. F5 TaxID=1813816 RepID=UPI000B1EE589|nr:LysR family transcriptional regulator [Leisingera sp. F5]
MLDRYHLAILREVHRAGSVTAAADRMNLSQSAVSHAVSKLEKFHQVKVWRKKGRSLEFTQAGSYLLELADRIVPELEHAEGVLAGMARGLRGILRLGMECHPCEKWLMQVTASYLAEWPNVELEVRTEFRFDGVAALEGHEIDLLITPDPVTKPGLLFAPVFDYEIMLAVRDDHSLAAQLSAEPACLTDQTLITVPVSTDRLDIYTRFLIPAGCRPQRRIEVESIDLMLQLVAAGRGLAVLPDWLISETGAGLPVRAVKIGETGLPKSINVGLRQADTDIDYVSGFLRLARGIPVYKADMAPTRPADAIFP